MKKILLSLGAISSLTAMSQSITVNDTLSTGLSTNYFVMDSLAPSLSAITGTSVTWNYSTLAAYENATILDQIIDASASTYASDYTTSDYNDDLSGGASIYFSNTPDSVVVHGYVFEADGNLVKVFFDINSLKSLELPMTVGDSYTDAIAGVVNIMGADFPATGSATVTCDGAGTLQVSGDVISNVIRIKLVETIDASITVPFPVSGTVTRTVYSYYDLANDKQPILVHATLDITSDVLNDNYTAVYYAGTPMFMEVDENTEMSFSIFPNPSSDLVTINLTQPVSQVTIYNAVGQIVFQQNQVNNSMTVNVSNWRPGIYVVQANNNGILNEQKLVIK